MSWLVWVIAVAVFAIVGGAVAALGRRGQLPSGDGLLAVVTTIYVTGLALGPFVTAFSSPTVSTWWHALLVRVVWQLTGASLMVAMVWVLAWTRGSGGRRSIWILSAVLGLVPLILARNPLADLASGPVTYRAVDFDVHRWQRTRGGGAIEARLRVRDPRGQERTLDLAGWKATTAESKLATCGGAKDVDVQVLEHVERVLDVSCR